VLEEAVAYGADLVVAYHPPVFAPLKAVTAEDAKGSLILRACERRIAIYSPHTALDAAEGGINDWLCTALPAGAVRPIRSAGALPGVLGDPGVPGVEGSYKLMTFVPPAAVDRVSAALAGAGAGRIGAYTQCSFVSAGRGSFRGGPATHPAVGRRGRMESVEEQRLEMVVPGAALGAVVAALRQAHPYEEPAFDIYRREEVAPPLSDVQARSPTLPARSEAVGPGRVVTLPRALAGGPRELARRVATHLGVPAVELALPAVGRPIRTVGFCAGAGAALFKDAGPIDAWVTGEMRHHDVLDAVARGIAVVLAGHTQTERPYLPVYRRRIVAGTAPAVAWKVSRADRPPTVREMARGMTRGSASRG
jgi:putative NIF3 family GTP cyclohydrolase 1 type 2